MIAWKHAYSSVILVVSSPAEGVFIGSVDVVIFRWDDLCAQEVSPGDTDKRSEYV